MILLLDIGNTNTHLGLADDARVRRQMNIPTTAWFDSTAPRFIEKIVGRANIHGVAICSVVPRATPAVRQLVKRRWTLTALELTPKTVRGVTINYPNPRTIWPDRLANAVAVRHHFGAPAAVADFGTPVTFDVVKAKGGYVRGIIVPGLLALED